MATLLRWSSVLCLLVARCPLAVIGSVRPIVHVFACGYSMIRKHLTLAAFIVAVVAATCVAQSTIGVFTGLRLNGNTISATAGTATVTIPNSTQTMIGTTTLCTTGNYCTASVTLTDAQIKALPTTGIAVVAAPASGHRVKLISATFIATTTAGAYTNINTTYAALTLEANSDAWLTVGVANDSTTSPALTTLTDFLGAAGATLIDVPAAYAGVPATTTQGWVVPNIAVGTAAFDAIAVKVFIDNNGSGNLTGGNAANTLKVVVTYRDETL